MNIQGSSISGSYNSTSKTDTFVKKTDERKKDNKDNVKIAGTKPSSGTESKRNIEKKIDDNFGSSRFVTYSENLKKQSLGLKAYASNAKDGANIIETAVDSLKESQAILNRMKEISKQAEDSNLSTSDREVLQKELTSLASDIDDISKNTTHEGVKLFNGDGVTKVYKEAPAYDTEKIIIKKEFIDASFDDKGNSFYKENSSEALSREDALKELQEGNTLYKDALMKQDEFDYEKWQEDNPSTSVNGSAYNPVGDSVDASGNSTVSAIVTPDNPNNFTFSMLSYNVNEKKASSIKSEDVGLKDQYISISKLADTLNNYDELKDKFSFSVSEDGSSLVITSKDSTKYEVTGVKLENDYVKPVMDSGHYDVDGNKTGEVAPTTPLPDLYSKGGSTKLDADEAKEKLNNGEALYTNAFRAQTKAENKTDYEYTPSKTVLREEKVPISDRPVKDIPAENKAGTVSYKTFNFQLNDAGNKFASARIDRLDSDSLGISDLSIRSESDAVVTSKRIDEALTQVSKQKDYLESIGSRLKEASTLNDKNSDNIKEAQKLDAKNNPVKTEPKPDIYQALEQTILDNANKASEDSINLLNPSALSDAASKTN